MNIYELTQLYFDALWAYLADPSLANFAAMNTALVNVSVAINASNPPPGPRGKP